MHLLFSQEGKKGMDKRLARTYRIHILYRIRIRLAGLHYENPADFTTFRRYRVHFLISV